jgi:two-component system response regulator DctR
LTRAVVLLDVRMAPLSGLVTFERLKALGCPWPVLFLTGNGDVDVEARRLRLALSSLSPREREVLDELIRGHYNKNIAAHLGITSRTVEFHRANIFEKMGVNSAIELAHKLGQLAPLGTSSPG